MCIRDSGTISDIPREEYEEAEERVINELRSINKPFIILLNSQYPEAEETISLAGRLQERYGVTVLPVNCLNLSEEEIRQILSKVLFEFPVKEIKIEMPRWLSSLEKGHWLRSAVYNTFQQTALVFNFQSCFFS